MCGIHSVDGQPIDHDHGPDGSRISRPVFRPRPRGKSRRAFLGEFGRGAVALAVVTPLLVACGDEEDGLVAPRVSESYSPDSTAVADPTRAPAEQPAATAEEVAAEAASPTAEAETAAAAEPDLRWARANLGFVSAYVLARGNTAALVDTGVAGSADAIGETLATLGLTYDDVGHVILTHNHGDHAGSIGEVVNRATNATVYAGEEDVGGIPDTDIVGVVGGQDVFGFEMIATPGHTPGHMCVIDHAASVLVAGDAIFGQDGGVVEGPERFFNDVELSRRSIEAMAQLSYNTLLFGHGEPIEADADTAVQALAASFA